MKRILLALAIFGLLLPATRQAEAGTDVSIDFFYNNLGSDGNWVEVADYGYCWQPSVSVSNRNWRPYADGYWAYTDVGWTWISYESFGWATYHYGRWARVRGHGWMWVPGREWGPAWVSWRTGGDYVGWAPLPPRRYAGGGEIVYEGRPIGDQVDIDFDIGPSYYNFVDVRYIGEPVLRERIFAPSQNITYINSTVNVTNITYSNNTVYNYGPDYNRLSAYSTRPIQRLALQRETNVDLNAAAQSGSLTKVQGNTLMVAAPQEFQKPAQSIAPKALKTKIEKPDLETGWSDVSDAKAKTELQAKMKKEDPKAIPPAQLQPKNPAALTAPSPTPIKPDTKEPAASPAETGRGNVLTSPVPAASATPAVAEKEDGRGKGKGASPVPSVPPAPNASPAGSVAPKADGKGKRDQLNVPEATVAPVKKPEATAPPVKAATPAAPSTPPAAPRGEQNEKGPKVSPKPAITPAAPLTTPPAQSKPAERGPKKSATEPPRAGGSAPGAPIQGENGAAPGKPKAERPTAAPPIKPVNEQAPPPPPRAPAATRNVPQTNPPVAAPQGRPAKAPDAAPAAPRCTREGQKGQEGR